MNTPLQVEHPVTEQVTGVDMVRAQLLVAAGEPLPWAQSTLAQRGHAIEARVYAEDPSQGFIPQAGVLERYREPCWPGVRVDTGVAEGGDVTVYYDPMIAKVIATAESRPLAINRLASALRTFEIGGLRTNLAFLIRILELDEFRRGAIDTAFLDRESARLTKSLPDAISVFSNPQSPIPSPQSFDPWSGSSARAAAKPAARRMRSREDAGGAIVAPMPATVITVKVKPGDIVKRGDLVLLLEAMKMELPLRAPADATVSAVHCREGELVQGEAVLVEFAQNTSV
jgi:acetyl/propionyl-CoA carboxylase alpha subunit